MEGFIFDQTAQIPMNRGLKVFGDSGAHAVHKAMETIHDGMVSIPIEPAKLSCGSRSSVLKYLMFMKIKRYGSIMVRGCEYGRPNAEHPKKETSSPKVSIEYLLFPVKSMHYKGESSPQLTYSGNLCKLIWKNWFMSSLKE